MELAEETGLKVSEPNLTRYDLFNAGRMFSDRHGRGDHPGGED